eukprot:c35982_g1_i1 orf=1-597(-)
MGCKNCFRCRRRTCAFVSKVWLAAILTMGLYISTDTIMGGKHNRISVEHLQLFTTERHLADLGDAPRMNSGQAGAIRRQLFEKEIGKTLRLKLIHSNSPDSPVRRHYASHLEELKEIFAADAERLKSFHAPIWRRMQSHSSEDFSINARAPAAEPSPSPEADNHLDRDRQPVKEKAFESPIISGSSLGNIGQYFVEFYI